MARGAISDNRWLFDRTSVIILIELKMSKAMHGEGSVWPDKIKARKGLTRGLGPEEGRLWR